MDNDIYKFMYMIFGYSIVNLHKKWFTYNKTIHKKNLNLQKSPKNAENANARKNMSEKA